MKASIQIHSVWCKCDECQQKREDWASRQPPLIESLDARDSEDNS